MNLTKKIKSTLYPLKQWTKYLYTYPPLKWRDTDYNLYWQHRKLTSQTPLNSFQKKRAELSLLYVESGSSVLDIGGGNGRVLLYIHNKKPLESMIVADISKEALAMAKENYIETAEVDISKIDTLEKLPSADYILMFEILEHIPNSEEMLAWAVTKAKKGVLFSVPNTGFVFHRLRLLGGRFPLQWRLMPSEHLRFWTAKDMKWWLKQLELEHVSYKFHAYEGVPVLNKIWPSLFAQGLFVYINKK